MLSNMLRYNVIKFLEDFGKRISIIKQNKVDNEKDLTSVYTLENLIDYAEGSVISKAIIKKPSGSVTLFSFDKGEELSEHTAPFDALVQILDGEAVINIADKKNIVSKGMTIMLPANKPHALKAEKRFKMLLTMIRS